MNQLAEEGLVEFIENVAHKRSHLVRLMRKDYLDAMFEFWEGNNDDK